MPILYLFYSFYGRTRRENGWEVYTIRYKISYQAHFPNTCGPNFSYFVSVQDYESFEYTYSHLEHRMWLLVLMYIIMAILKSFPQTITLII